MSRNENFEQGAGSESVPVDSPAFVTKGGGSAIHIAHVYPGGNLSTKCDKWGSSGAYSSRIKPSQAEAPTCKSCIRNHERSANS